MSFSENLNNKVFTRESLIKKIEEWRHQKCKIVFTNGCFDLLHLGHVDYLAKAADLGNYLIIGGGKQPIGKHNEYNCDENTILCASHGTAGYISMYPVKTFLTMAFAFIENKQLINI